MNVINIIAILGLIMGVILLFNQYSFYELGDKRYNQFRAHWYLILIAINTCTLSLPYIL